MKFRPRYANSHFSAAGRSFFFTVLSCLANCTLPSDRAVDLDDYYQKTNFTVTSKSNQSIAFHYSLQAPAAVTATVPPEECTPGQMRLLFGPYVPTSGGTTAIVSYIYVTCTSGTPYAILLDSGLHEGGDTGAMHRQLMGQQGRYLGYLLSIGTATCDAAVENPSPIVPVGATNQVTPNQTGVEWGNGAIVGTSYPSYISTSSSAAQCFQVVMQIPAGQDVLPDQYTDQINVTIDY
jgi:spore coat protein U-like protein